ncbi:MAG TPA: glycosyltransferase, partial [bacterium]|nr:glycosyltransferase [bacterium]
MNILHVLSGDFVTGAETSTAAVIERQLARGHRVFIASGAFPHATKAVWVRVPVYDRRPWSRLANILALARLVRREDIDLLHAHSRAASWVSHWAAKLTGRAYLSTLHGRQHLHFSNIHFNI